MNPVLPKNSVEALGGLSKLHYDAATGEFTLNSDANKWVNPSYRKGRETVEGWAFVLITTASERRTPFSCEVIPEETVGKLETVASMPRHIPTSLKRVETR